MNSPPALLQHFQNAFSQRMRNPEIKPLAGIPPRPGALYEKLLFNNLCGFIDRCFPVSKQRLGEESWRNLARDFYREHFCETPYFREIPLEFIAYIQESSADLPAWLPELLHYEWVELAVATNPAALPIESPPIESLPMRGKAVVKINPTLHNLQYHWPVQRLSADTANDEIPAPGAITCLLVYRNRDHKVQFMQSNPLTACLLQLLAEGPSQPDQLANALHKLFPTTDRQSLSAQINALLAGLLLDEAIFVVTI